MTIKNIIFDVGNVLVRWDPTHIVSVAFPEYKHPSSLAQSIFKHQTWLDLNLGLITEKEAILHYSARLGLEQADLAIMMQIVKTSLVPIPGSFELLTQLYQEKYHLYALTDNTKEIMAYLKEKYDFWRYFKGVVVSAEIGHLKPSKAIYAHLLQTYQLNAKETVFIDDLLVNVEGAKALGIEGIAFRDAQTCRISLEKLLK